MKALALCKSHSRDPRARLPLPDSRPPASDGPGHGAGTGAAVCSVAEPRPPAHPEPARFWRQIGCWPPAYSSRVDDQQGSVRTPSRGGAQAGEGHAPALGGQLQRTLQGKGRADQTVGACAGEGGGLGQAPGASSDSAPGSPRGLPNTERESCTLRALAPAAEGMGLGALLARWALCGSTVTPYTTCAEDNRKTV